MSQMLEMTSMSSTNDVVAVTVPADGGWLGVLRTAAAGLAARLLFSGDKIEDLRIAVDEACAMLLVLTAPDGELRCRFEISAHQLIVAISAPVTTGAKLPGSSSFAWKVLAGLTDGVSADEAEGVATIRLIAVRPAS